MKMINEIMKKYPVIGLIYRDSADGESESGGASCADFPRGWERVDCADGFFYVPSRD